MPRPPWVGRRPGSCRNRSLPLGPTARPETRSAGSRIHSLCRRACAMTGRWQAPPDEPSLFFRRTPTGTCRCSNLTTAARSPNRTPCSGTSPTEPRRCRRTGTRAHRRCRGWFLSRTVTSHTSRWRVSGSATRHRVAEWHANSNAARVDGNPPHDARRVCRRSRHVGSGRPRARPGFAGAGRPAEGRRVSPEPARPRSTARGP